MTTYNNGEFILNAINSILNQTIRNFEFIIIDDGSEDNTQTIVSGIKDSRISYEYIPHAGRASALNYGLKKCSSDLVALMDSDDVCLPDRLKKQISYIDKNKVDVISAWYGIFVNNNLKYIIKTPEEDPEIKKALALHSVISNPGVMFRKSIVLDAGGYETIGNNFGFEDYLLWLRIKDKAKFYNIPEVLILQRYRSDSISRMNLYEKHKQVYNLQAPFYDDGSICPENETEKNELYGWREYFYGNPVEARKYWFSLKWELFTRIKILPAIMVSFLPVGVIIQINELRLKFRIKYVLNYFSSRNRYLRKFLKGYIVEWCGNDIREWQKAGLLNIDFHIRLVI